MVCIETGEQYNLTPTQTYKQSANKKVVSPLLYPLNFLVGWLVMGYDVRWCQYYVCTFFQPKQMPEQTRDCPAVKQKKKRVPGA